MRRHEEGGTLAPAGPLQDCGRRGAAVGALRGWGGGGLVAVLQKHLYSRFLCCFVPPPTIPSVLHIHKTWTPCFLV